MLKDLIETFRKPSAEVLAQRELEDAKRQLLQEQTLAEHYTARVRFQRERIVRLANMLNHGVK